MRLVRDLVFVSAVLGGALILASGALRPQPAMPTRAIGRSAREADLGEVVGRVNALFRQQWAESKVAPAAPASDLTILRRLSLALRGTIPSLEEIRQFEARPREGRLEGWLDDFLRDRRTADYLAERFARALVGTEDGPFVQFRRRRFTTWLSDAILENRPYDAIVRDLLCDQGLWTDHPATNFISVTFNQESGRPDPERLAARVSRAFLGARIDCAQCHDHPFQPWKQADFRGLAAFFGGVYSSLRGVRDRDSTYQPLDRKTKEPLSIEPQVPFHPELLPARGNPRQRLAGWIVSPGNPSLARATANRVWALLLGRPLVDPVDDLPVSGDLPPVLELLADDFRTHGYALDRLIRIIAAAQVFRLESTDIPGDEAKGPHDENWAAFPMTRLRPEQVAGSIFQAASLGTLGPQSPWYVRLAEFAGSNEFVRRYGDSGEDKLTARGGTIPQRLLLLNGDLVEEKSGDAFLSASRRIAELAPSDRAAVEIAYLAVLTRRPTPEEASHFESRLARTTKQTRKDRLADLFWTLFNSTEFSWNH
jgi:hypothetical protein